MRVVAESGGGEEMNERTGCDRSEASQVGSKAEESSYSSLEWSSVIGF